MDFDDMKRIGEAYLAHHGVEGQQWGKRNGPPYPLEGSGKRNFVQQVREQRRQRRRKKILKDPAKIIKYQDEFTIDEIEEALKKIDEINKVRERVPKDQNKPLTRKQKAQARDAATLRKNLDKFSDDDYQKAVNRLKRKNELADMVIDDAKKPAKVLGVGTTYAREVAGGISAVKSGINDVSGIHDSVMKMSGKGLTYDDRYKLYAKSKGISDKGMSDADLDKLIDRLRKKGANI